MMSGVRSKHTRPELLVRRFLHARGFRYRLHDRGLPGRPDIVLRRFRTIVDVRGCFWHQHPGCRFAVMPSSNRAFWQDKLGRNMERDSRNTASLQALGWHVCVMWECQAGDPAALERLALEIPENLRGR